MTIVNIFLFTQGELLNARFEHRHHYVIGQFSVLR